MKNVLVTGGLGYIGSHICVELLSQEYNVFVIDNLENSDEITYYYIETIASRNFVFEEIDLLDKDRTEDFIKEHNIDAIIHCAGKKAVSESVKIPLQYYKNNIMMTINILELVEKYNIGTFIFSSSATIYGSQTCPFNETMLGGIGITNPYGQTKFMQEQIIRDFSKIQTQTNFFILRYFNPVGCHHSGIIGENPVDIPNNLMPYMMRVAMNNNYKSTRFSYECYNSLTIFGDDYETDDGTCERDFIHVVDLAKAHIEMLKTSIKTNLEIFNIGTGFGVSVLELVEGFKRYNNCKLDYEFGSRRDGDIAVSICDPTKILTETNWKPEYSDIQTIVTSAWEYMKKNI